MEIKDKKQINKYLNINKLAISRICYFKSKKEKIQNRIQIIDINKSKIIINTYDKLRYSEGFFVFHSYTFIFKFWTKLHKEKEENIFSCDVPDKIETFDQRKHIRFIYEPEERKLINVFIDNLKIKINVIIADISAGGIGLIIEDEDSSPDIGSIFSIKTNILGLEIDTLVKVINIYGNKAGCIFIDQSNKFQLNLNHLIIEEVEWRSETLLVHLKKLYLKKQEEENKKKENEEKQKIDQHFVESFRKHFILEIKDIIGVSLKEKEIVVLEHTIPNFLSSIYFSFKFNKIEFRAFFYMDETAIYKIAKFVFKKKPPGFIINANEILAEIGTQLFDRSKTLNEEPNFAITAPSVIQSNKRLMAFLYKSPSIKIIFATKLGEATLLLLPGNLKN